MKELFDRYENLLKEGRTIDASGLRQVIEMHIESLEQFESAYKEWSDKTEWVQKTAQPREFGKHRADVLRERIEALENEMQEQARIIGMGAERELALIAKVESLEKENASLKQDAERLDYLIDNQAFVDFECDNYWLEYADGTGQSTDHKSPRDAIDTAMQKD